MIILYIEENARAAKDRQKVIEYNLMPGIIERKMPGRIELITGVKFIFISKFNLDKIRGLEPAVVFLNAHVSCYEGNMIFSRVRGKI